MFFHKKDDDATVVGLLASGLRRDICFGELAPDQRLKIEDLRQRYGGSAHSLREALMALASEGLVEANAQRGFRVASATDGDLRDILRLRAEVECLGLDWSLTHGDVAWEGRVIAARHALQRAEDAVARDPMAQAMVWDEAAKAFHEQLVAASGSVRLISLQERFFIESRRFRLAALRDSRIDFARTRATEDLLLAAILARTPDVAVQLLRSLILDS
jgi:GntR family transcriptional regulator, carbon starvation induced regulator